MFVPNGNCRHGAESGRVINQKHISVRHDYVVGKLILRDNFGDVPWVHFVLGFSSSPLQYIAKASLTFYLFSQRYKL